jgi:hypothetical protein
MQHASILKVVHWIFVTRSSCRAHPAFTEFDLSSLQVAKLVRHTSTQVPRREDTQGREDKYSRIQDFGIRQYGVGVYAPSPLFPITEQWYPLDTMMTFLTFPWKYESRN